MEQVKRFLFDVKDAYDADRHEWLVAKEEFKTQLEVKENLWVECYLRLNEIVNVVSDKKHIKKDAGCLTLISLFNQDKSIATK